MPHDGHAGEPGRGGDIVGVTARAEGSLWIGMEDFVSTDHMIQNTATARSTAVSSPSPAARREATTFKLLYNGAVSMTGGQDAIWSTVARRGCRQPLRQGVTGHRHRDTNRYTNGQPRPMHGTALASSKHKKCLVQPQASPYSSTIMCPSSGAIANADVVTPTDRIVIDHRICEGCGTVAAPATACRCAFDTPWGRKTASIRNSNLDQLRRW